MSKKLPKSARFDAMTEVLLPALEHAAASIHHPTCEANPAGRAFQRKANPMCACHVGKAKLALSMFQRYPNGQALFSGTPSPDEFRAAVGAVDGRTWVLARKTSRMVERYGEDAVFLTQGAYADAERRAINARAAKLGVSGEFLK